ncbi:hypothetical protein WICANDRAFT_25197 [Wickerhamomyces anomalus NRRL Y-366-8]|uniref:Maf-like protein n=1 Tax=Wickerhamomyces anomalus (strain ATCC 58044 / CBS 1984 / NCYC 433 / NRRL Y-366-8) TaxID=683960 RepID=A0A1E3PBN7_WICAA|nr:uncharacterized protein WICANDRAFT_25197 [Wickerhamomyces anomalus NRRL Y-366-8]ODQ62826.1 hypothetical protein WICANDRAFT_25197 [Wickerhamomyces anomalus NRRL Y-366-8]
MSFQPFKHPVFDKIKEKRFILASTSPRRIEILTQMGFENVEVYPSNFPEDLKKEDYTPQDYVLNTAIGKAQAVYEELKNKGEAENTIILAADTVVEIDGQIFEKPKDKQDQLKNLTYYRDSKKVQHVLSGVVVINEGVVSSFVEDTALHFDYEASDEMLKAYVDTNEGLGVAAGYRVQLRGSLLMKKIDGDYYNAVGLPFRNTFKLIEKALGV